MRLTRREWAWDVVRAALLLAIGVLLFVILPDGSVSWRSGPVPSPPAWTALAAMAGGFLGETLRRAHPIVGLGLGVAALLAGVLVTGVSPIGVVIMFADLLYYAVRFSSSRSSWAVAGGTGIVLAGLALASLVSAGGRAAVLTVMNLSLLLAVPVLWALEVRRHSEQADIERDRAAKARRMAELDRAAAVAAERASMARDLHDVIAGQLSGIAIQSEAALTVPDPDPAVLRRVLESVRRDSVASLGEMRAMIGLLRADGAGDGDARTSPAGLDQLQTLLDTGRSAGLHIDVEDRRPENARVPPAVDMAAYRIVQEGLTNAAKHAPRSTAHLVLRCRKDALEIELYNELAPNSAAQAGGTGTGLLGLTERATAVGGRLEAGPHGRNWHVRAALPVPVPEGAAR